MMDGDGPTPCAPSGASQSSELRELTALFLRLGLTAFGGPAAHIALMEDEVVRRRGWMTHDAFLDLLGATNLIPGPSSTEMALHIGHARAGARGLVVAGAAFILPASLVTGALAWAYVRFGALPQVDALLYGVKPVIIAVILQALSSLVPKAVKTTALAAIGIVALVATALGVNELLVLALSGVAAAWLAHPRRRSPSAMLVVSAFGTSVAAPAAAAGAPAAFSLSGLFLVFAKIGSVLFGSGYVLLAFLRADLVERRHWLTETQLLDAITAGQITPGPVFTTATFIGYLLGGAPGAVAATLGIFLPAFVFVALSGLLLPRLRRSKAVGAFLDGVNVASLALMAFVTFQLGRASLVDGATCLLAVVTALVLLRFKVSSTWMILAGALVGLAMREPS